MKFRLVYDGPLLATQGEPVKDQRERRAGHKHEIRRVFHRQLKHLWATNKFLSEHKLSRKRYNSPRPIADDGAYYGRTDDYDPMAEVIADLNQRNGYRFVPLVREDWFLTCSLSVLFLRRDFPGSVIQAGDIDNRIKTLIDALRMPKHPNELVGNEVPREGEDPFYVLMEDDNLVSHFDVEADTLLDPPTRDNIEQRRAHLVITVDIRTYYTTQFNLSFAS